MTTTRTRPSSRATADVAADLAEFGEVLALEVERYLAARTRATAYEEPCPACAGSDTECGHCGGGGSRPACHTAHPLITKTTANLVAEALGTVPEDDEPDDEPPFRPLSAASPLTGAWRLLPDAWLRIRRPRGAVNYRPLTVAQHLELTAAILERDWSQTGGRGRRLTRRCILGAQVALYAMGYGDAQTAEAAGTYINLALREAGQAGPYEGWNEVPGRTRDQVLALVRAAASMAREARR